MKESTELELLPVVLDLFDGDGGDGDGNGGTSPGGPAVPETPTGSLPQEGRPIPQGWTGRERAEAQLRDWDSQAEQVRTLYPSFDLGREAQNRNFLALLRSGVPVRQAFEVLHMDEIRAATERAVTANIKAKGSRPQENGAGAAAGFTVKDGVSRLTARDRAEYARRAARGEVITF